MNGAKFPETISKIRG